MLKAYERTLIELREKFFNHFGIKPKYIHDGCDYFKEIKGHDLCIMGESGEINTHCEYAKKVYPDITERQLLELIAYLSQHFQVTFSFERGVEDIENTVLNMAINYTDEQGSLKEDVKRIFGSGKRVYTSF